MTSGEPARRGAGAARRRVTVAIPVALVVLGALTVWRLATGSAAHEFVGSTMGTTFSVTVEADLSTESSGRVRALIEDRLDRVERVMSTYDSASELSRLNRHRSTEPLPVSHDLLEVLVVAREVSEQSGGAFDVTVAPLVEAWGFGPRETGAARPASALVATLLDHVGYRRIVVDEDAGTARKTDEQTVIDLSGIAKGYAAERVSEGLLELGYADHLVEVGGELKAMGARREGRAWRVGIESPEEAGPGVYGTLELSDEAIATSGDYRNYFESEGVRYAHIIDPRTGRPTPFRGMSVSVVHPNGAEADAWATALTVLGPEEGYALARRLGLAALFVLRSEEGLESLATPRIVDRFTPAWEDRP